MASIQLVYKIPKRILPVVESEPVDESKKFNQNKSFGTTIPTIGSHRFRPRSPSPSGTLNGFQPWKRPKFTNWRDRRFDAVDRRFVPQIPSGAYVSAESDNRQPEVDVIKVAAELAKHMEEMKKNAEQAAIQVSNRLLVKLRVL